MEYRKLIKFGNSSHVISIPSTWIQKNNLKKGDTLYLEENGNNELIVLPKEINREKEEKEIIINTDRKDPKLVKREVIAAYLNNYNNIRVMGKDLSGLIGPIREGVDLLMACEVLEQNHQYILCKDFLNVSELSPKELIRKMDNITRAMFLDFEMLGINTDLAQFKGRAEDVKKISFVIYRILKAGLKDPSLIKRHSLSNFEMFHWWYLAESIEYIAQDIKNFCIILSLNKLKKNNILGDIKFKELISTLKRLYEHAVTSFYKNDYTLALTVSDLKYTFEEKCDNYIERNQNESFIGGLIERFKMIIKRINAIAREVYSN